MEKKRREWEVLNLREAGSLRRGSSPVSVIEKVTFEEEPVGVKVTRFWASGPRRGL